jgi:multisubunit Na+/H+ antiporter MnhE subunit
VTARRAAASAVGIVIRTLALALMWGALWADLGLATLTTGVLVAIGVQAVFPALAPHPSGRVNVLAVIRLLAIFSAMLVTANLAVLRRVLAPRIAITPAVVEVDLPICTDAVATVVANAVTLTPGTLTLDVSRLPDGVRLLVHNLDADDPEAVRADVMRLYDLVDAAFPSGPRPVRTDDAEVQ